MSIPLTSQRVLHGTTDVSIKVNDFRVTSYAATYTAGEYFYIGSSSPINNLWIEMSTPATSTAGSPTVKVWWGNAWVDVVDTLDYTAGLTKSGRIAWTLDRLKGWDMEQDSADVTGLSATAVYDLYWARISWASSFTAGILYMGQKFSDDTAFASFYPDLMQAGIMSGYKAAKTTWDEQHFMASEAVIKDLAKRSFITARGQVFSWQLLEEASCHKAAEIIYGAFGLPYKEHVLNARKNYEQEIGQRLLGLDSNKDGHLDVLERQETQGWVSR